ncbi:MAG: hypothetical protein GX804_05740, partial [Lentisphaerae bacterium]|nr:hypothetical protein [Lentisphaerota bacterium]
MKISKKIISIIAIFLAVSAIATMAEDNMGWLNNSSGTYEYFDTANWYDGVVNGLFSTNITSKSTQNITFSSDFDVTSDTFNFNYPGEVTFTFRGDGENDVWATVLDDIVISPKTTKGRINFGTPTEGQKINFDLGGECRTLTTTFSPLYFRNTFINGSLIVKGGGWMRLDGDDASAADVDVTAEYSTTLNYISEGEGAKRAHNLTMQSANLIVRGNSSVDSVNEITESITLDAGEMGGVNFITVEAGSRNSKLYTSEIIRRNGAIVCMRGHNFGDLPDGGV